MSQCSDWCRAPTPLKGTHRRTRWGGMIMHMPGSYSIQGGYAEPAAAVFASRSCVTLPGPSPIDTVCCSRDPRRELIDARGARRAARGGGGARLPCDDVACILGHARRVRRRGVPAAHRRKDPTLQHRRLQDPRAAAGGELHRVGELPAEFARGSRVGALGDMPAVDHARACHMPVGVLLAGRRRDTLHELRATHGERYPVRGGRG